VKFNSKEIYLILLRLLSKVARIEPHALQVAYIAKKIGDDIGFSPKRLNTLGFLHDIGLLNPSKVNRMQRTHGIENATMTDWIALDNDLHENHSVVGARILSHIKDLSYFADVIEKHHYQAMILDPENDHDVMAGIIHLADTVSVGLLMNTPGAESVTRIKNIIASSDEFLKPVVESFDRLSSRKGFWWSSTDRDTLFDEFSSDLEENPLNNVDLQAVGDILMYMVDVKSSFTMNHTERISHLSRLLAERVHLGQERALEVFLPRRYTTWERWRRLSLYSRNRGSFQVKSCT